MNLKDLKYFVTVAELKHFGRAAEACFVSQPTLSMQLKKLEESLGTPLLERQPRTVLLTPAGRAVLPLAQEMLRLSEDIRTVAARLQDPGEGELRLGAFPTLAPYLFPHVVPPLRARHPRLKLYLVEEKTETLIQQLGAGRLDAALLAEPVDRPQFDHLHLFQEDFLLAAPASHPLAGRTRIRAEDLRSEALLLLTEGHCLRDQALEFCSLSGTREREEFRATSLETLRQMVASGMGITLLPELTVRPPVQNPAGLELVPFEAPAPNRRIALYWRRQSPLAQWLRQLGEQMLEAVENLGLGSTR